tara:strand:+ start:676 stop:804 length:129 start_codon:yes stop_codon:yes gene_type:complete
MILDYVGVIAIDISNGPVKLLLILFGVNEKLVGAGVTVLCST